MRPAGPNGAPCDMPPGALAEDDYPKCGQIGTSGPPRAPRTAFAPGMFFENRPGGQAPGTDRSGPFFQAGLFSPRTPPQHRASIAGSISGVRRRHHCTRTGTANATRPTRRATAEARPTVARSMADAGSTAGQGSRGGASSRVTQVPKAWEARRSRANTTSSKSHRFFWRQTRQHGHTVKFRARPLLLPVPPSPTA